jgi:general secretion pathway protein N
MRFALPLGRSILFVAALAFALVALLPLSVAIGWFGLAGRGLAAREANGSLWAGALKEAQFGPVALGDVEARLNLLPLLLGRARLSLRRDGADGRFEGAVTMTRHGFGLDDLDGQLRPAALLAPLPLATLDFTRVSVHFANGRCDHAEGEVRAGLSGDVGGMLLTLALRGAARCEQGALLLPLASQSGLERLDLRFAGDGSWRAELSARGAGRAGFVRRIDGNF